MIGEIHHIAYLVKNLDKSLNVFKTLGYTQESQPFYDKVRDTDFVFLIKGETRVELVMPHEDSDIYPLLKKYANSIYHVCYEVKDMVSAVEYLQDKGFLPFRERQKAPAISETAEVIFLMHTGIGIVELLQEG